MSIPYTFFSYQINFLESLDQIMPKLVTEEIVAGRHTVLLAGTQHVINKTAKALLTRLNVTVIQVNPTGVWNKFWRHLREIEELRLDPNSPLRQAGGLRFISLLPPEAIHCALKRHRSVGVISQQEELWLDTLHYDEKFDDFVGDMFDRMDTIGPGKRQYRELSLQEAFDLSAFEGLRFTRPVHDAVTTAILQKAKGVIIRQSTTEELARKRSFMIHGA